ncbi:hypothetical protein EGT74_24545 [Chitinophaga lutea]|uniref:Uncharacterized protein n=1 Tax=Chitinophaga lutea TaxID=2488634 RepID=A0A3N4PBE9_9BACT|nr:hypothetical protein [Chitinophaga lutea]RPE05556.1 hypothetical protein EGT74_24545 [Chitinophaga lutea]
MTKEEKEILAGTADTILEKPVLLIVDRLNPKWWEKIAIKLGWLKAKRKFEIRPATLGSVMKISRLMLEIEPVKDGTSPIAANYQLLSQHGERLAEVIGQAITNTEAGPSKSLVRFIRENMTGSEILTVTIVVMKQLNVSNFLSTITLMRGVSLLKPEESIASGGQSAA